MPSILLIDDEETLRVSLSFTLDKEGFQVLTAADGPAALEVVRSSPLDLIILDLMLPGLSGLELCHWLRRFTDAPILMLTARGDVEDKVTGLRLGADDYVTKPFNPRELIARIYALLRRPRQVRAPLMNAALPTRSENEERGGRTVPSALVQSGVLDTTAVRLDLDRHEAFVRGELVPLSPKEFDLLHTLLSHRGRVVTREALLATVWGRDFMGDPRTLDVHIRWLRGKLEEQPAHPRLIVTVRGIGFRFDDPAAEPLK